MARRRRSVAKTIQLSIACTDAVTPFSRSYRRQSLRGERAFLEAARRDGRTDFLLPPGPQSALADTGLARQPEQFVRLKEYKQLLRQLLLQVDRSGSVICGKPRSGSSGVCYHHLACLPARRQILLLAPTFSRLPLPPAPRPNRRRREPRLEGYPRRSRPFVLFIPLLFVRRSRVQTGHSVAVPVRGDTVLLCWDGGPDPRIGVYRLGVLWPLWPHDVRHSLPTTMSLGSRVLQLTGASCLSSFTHSSFSDTLLLSGPVVFHLFPDSLVTGFTHSRYSCASIDRIRSCDSYCRRFRFVPALAPASPRSSPRLALSLRPSPMVFSATSRRPTSTRIPRTGKRWARTGKIPRRCPGSPCPARPPARRAPCSRRR